MVSKTSAFGALIMAALGFGFARHFGCGVSLCVRANLMRHCGQ
jgi:hypothetical protein